MKIVLLIMCSINILYIIYSLSKMSLKNFTSMKRSIFKILFILKKSSPIEFAICFFASVIYLIFNIIIAMLSIFTLKTALIITLSVLFITLSFIEALNIYNIRKKDISKKFVKESTMLEFVSLGFNSIYLIIVISLLLIQK